jgi:hypothetical protein
MRTKIKDVVIGAYEYDSIVVDIDGKTTEIVFDKKENISQYKGKEIELANDKGVYKIKPLMSAKKND